MTDIQNKLVGKRLEKIFNLLGYTRKSIAVRLQYSSTSMLTKILKGERSLTAKTLYLLSQEYNININYVLLGKGTPFIDSDQSHTVQEPSEQYGAVVDIYQVLADHERRLRMLEQQNQRTD